MDCKVPWPLRTYSVTKGHLIGMFNRVLLVLPCLLQIYQIRPSYLFSHSHENLCSTARNCPSRSCPADFAAGRVGIPKAACSTGEDVVAWAGFREPSWREAGYSWHIGLPSVFSSRLCYRGQQGNIFITGLIDM